ILCGGVDCVGNKIYNAAFLLDSGKISHIIHKHNLPNYGIFDEKRLFSPGERPQALDWRGHKLGIIICEDVWHSEISENFLNVDLQIAINASPYEIGKVEKRAAVVKQFVAITGNPFIYVNQIGGQDEVVFDGNSFVMNSQGQIVQKLAAFEEDFSVIEFPLMHESQTVNNQELEAEVYSAIKLGLHDYVSKNGFKSVILGLSGGIDSALVAAVAVDALGKQNVKAFMLPSPYTSQESLDDAAECAKMLCIEIESIDISALMSGFEQALAPIFAGKPKDISEENIQSRIRGNLLMAISNKEKSMLLTTGNKSEMAVGYATIYGDMCGGYNVLKDIYKTLVYRLAAWRNMQSPVIPERIITKAPSAELRPDQKDQDSLPPYDILDAILELLIEQRLSVSEIIANGFDADTVNKVARLLYLSEYKRFQSAPGAKITYMALGSDRRYPM
ncbi:MAG: NAD+ synthase, partial [Pseudomonadota bacterium]